MAAELHLAELTLHLFLQHPERLVDIVVPYENLHAVFLSRVGVAWTIGYGRDLGQRRRDAEAPGMFRSLRHSLFGVCIKLVTQLAGLTPDRTS